MIDRNIDRNIDENIEISRTDVTTLICKYIKENNLQNPDNKKIIIPDHRLKKLFNGYLGEEDQLEFFNIQTYLKYHFIKDWNGYIIFKDLL